MIATNLRTGRTTVVCAFGTPSRYKSDSLGRLYDSIIGQVLHHRPGLAGRLASVCGDGEVDRSCLSRRIKIIGTDKIRSQRINDIKGDVDAEITKALPAWAGRTGTGVTAEHQAKLFQRQKEEFFLALNDIYKPHGVLVSLRPIRPPRTVLEHGSGTYPSLKGHVSS